MGIAICGKIVLNCRLDNKSDCNPYILLGIPPGKFCCSSQSISSTCSSSRLVYELQLSSFPPFPALNGKLQLFLPTPWAHFSSYQEASQNGPPNIFLLWAENAPSSILKNIRPFAHLGPGGESVQNRQPCCKCGSKFLTLVPDRMPPSFLPSGPFRLTQMYLLGCGEVEASRPSGPSHRTP